ncbi:uncharacterized protein EDB91DRAFT_1327374 [Suillus paluster]|uniref:uncharacterized protein n=1 Tax=Suillus paluster TaxID=48578 RepID=UPI001B86F52D|nr:uncharacterized protein EDB91DRAFT_1327374 [Suillus paluster]KAG1749969.1 hypothetical protein EDB91DRAFT_1327374 [Suillus paluster]
MARARESSVALRLGGKTALATFVAVIFAFVGETQLTQYVQTTLGYQHSFFLFYIVHSSFIISFPLHLGYLLLTTHHSPRALLSGLSCAITAQLTSRKSEDSRIDRSSQFPLSRFLVMVLIMTAIYSIPALLWFIAVAYAPVTDVTAIWNANAFFAYVFSVKLLNLQWGFVRMCAVCLATVGVLTIVYGGSTPPILYKKYAALPSAPELAVESVHYTHIPASAEQAIDEEIVNEVVHSPPFGLHPNFLTASIGLCTMFILLGVWGPIVTSVGSLLTIVLTLISDLMLGSVGLTAWGLLGAGMIIGAFAVLAYDMFQG